MSSLPTQARGAASRTANSSWLEHLTRGGLVGYGIIHLLFAWLILQIAFDGSGTDGDQSGALHRLAEKPFGTFLIVVIVIGLIAMTLWQLLEAAIGHRAERGRHRWGRELGAGVVVVGQLVRRLPGGQLVRQLEDVGQGGDRCGVDRLAAQGPLVGDEGSGYAIGRADARG